MSYVQGAGGQGQVLLPALKMQSPNLDSSTHTFSNEQHLQKLKIVTNADDDMGNQEIAYTD